MVATSSSSFASSSQSVYNNNNNNNDNNGEDHNILLLLIQLICDTGIQMVFTSWKSGNIITSMLGRSSMGRWMVDSCNNNMNTNTDNNNDNTNDGIGSCMKHRSDEEGSSSSNFYHQCVCDLFFFFFLDIQEQRILTRRHTKTIASTLLLFGIDMKRTLFEQYRDYTYNDSSNNNREMLVEIIAHYYFLIGICTILVLRHLLSPILTTMKRWIHKLLKTTASSVIVCVTIVVVAGLIPGINEDNNFYGYNDQDMNILVEGILGCCILGFFMIGAWSCCKYVVSKLLLVRVRRRRQLQRQRKNNNNGTMKSVSGVFDILPCFLMIFLIMILLIPLIGETIITMSGICWNHLVNSTI